VCCFIGGKGEGGGVQTHQDTYGAFRQGKGPARYCKARTTAKERPIWQSRYGESIEIAATAVAAQQTPSGRAVKKTAW
jgi:hypothetical protein